METEKSQKKIRLQSSDGEIFEVVRDIISQSTTLNTMMQDLGLDDNEGDVDVVPLHNVSSNILKKAGIFYLITSIVLYLDNQLCIYHKGDPPATDDDNREKRTDDISSWDIEFLKLDQGTLFELILVANFLDIKGLLDAGCKIVANMIKEKSPEEIRDMFNIKNDFTSEEEGTIRK